MAENLLRSIQAGKDSRAETNPKAAPQAEAVLDSVRAVQADNSKEQAAGLTDKADRADPAEINSAAAVEAEALTEAADKAVIAAVSAE